MAKEIVQKKAAAVTIKETLLKQRENIKDALPKHLNADQMLRVVTTSIQRNPNLLRCDTTSLVGCVLESAALGLVPDGVTGQAYLVPYGQTCTLIIGYKGMMTLARRSGEISTITAEIVREGDEFECEMGDSPSLKHRVNYRGDRGAIIAVYAVALYKDGCKAFRVMTNAEVEAIRARSKAGRSGPWVTDWEAMAKKTAVRQLVRWLPQSTEDYKLARAIQLDEKADRGEQRIVADLVTGAVDFEDDDAEPAQIAETEWDEGPAINEEGGQ